MKLKRLEMIGFKSFADKTVIDFQDGITGIVGPNGSGKSNISDAIKWVLGEQRSRQLRGTNMQDVIFKGTQERQPLGYCEVSLVFDNTTRIFDTDYQEISITRKLYRSGESEYLMNKTKVRLKDITDLLHNAGIGKDGYFIIGQNKVTEIVMNKPADRRKIFEEAAGVMQYKESKRTSENQLAKTRENLTILENFKADMESRLDPLRRQASAAIKYYQLKSDLKSLDINNYIYQYENSNATKEKINIKISGYTDEISDKTKTLRATEQKSSEHSRAIEKIDDSVIRLHNRKTDLLVSKEKNSGETNLLREKQRSTKAEIERIDNELEVAENILLSERKELEQVQTEIEKLKDETLKLNDEITMATSEYAVLLDKLTRSELGSASSQKDMITALNKLSDIREDLAKLTSEENSLRERNEAMKEELNEVNAKFAGSQSQNSRLTESINKLKERQSELINEENNIQKIIDIENEKIKALSVELNENIKKISSTESRYKLLSDLERDYNGYNNGVTSILKASNVRKDIKDHLIGVVADMIDVPQEYRTAIETALGNNVQNILVENEDDAEMLIQFLKYNKFGQATFLPLTSAKSRKLNPRDINSFNMKGCLGIASDLIKYDPKIENAVYTLLGRVVICEDIHTARMLAKENSYNFRTVTLDGDQTFTNGSLSGGSQRSNVSHVLNRKKDIEDLKEQLDNMRELDNQKQRERILLNEDLDNNTRKLYKTREEIQSLKIEIAKENEILQTSLVSYQEYKKQLEHLTQQVSESNKRLLELTSEIRLMKIEEETLSSNRNVATESMELTQKQSDELKIEKERYQENISNIKVQISENNVKISADEDNILRLNNSISISESNIESLRYTRGIRVSEKEEIEAEIARLQNTKQYIEIEEEIDKVDKKLVYFDGYKKQLVDEQRQLNEDRTYLTTTIASLTEKKNQEEINLAKVDSDLKYMEDRVWEEYSLTYGNCLEYRIENYNVEQGLNEAQRCKRDIERLGKVNLNAVEELAELESKYGEMKEQIEDLQRAEKESVQIIDKISKELKTKFEDQFNKINENFSTVFTELFGGGKAKLVLTESETDDPLEQGVDIIAEPPGKKFANITLLSGGEQALTAIAILFAILRLRSMPFVVLDEVEAALDEMNVVRFAKYLNRFSKSTQFIVVTHRKPTMEKADRLCGVTIQNTVSIIVNIALSDAYKIVDEEAKKAPNK